MPELLEMPTHEDEIETLIQTNRKTLYEVTKDLSTNDWMKIQTAVNDLISLHVEKALLAKN